LVIDPNVVKGKGGHEPLLDVVRAYCELAKNGDASSILNKAFVELVSNVTDHDNKWVAAQLGLPDSQLCGLLRVVNAELRRAFTGM